jgi:hypothetical protein
LTIFKLVKRVKILGLVYSCALENIDQKDGSMGVVRLLLREIAIDPYADRIKSLTHEIVHAFAYALGGTLDEGWTDRIAQAAIAFMTDNPALVRRMVDYLEAQ